MRPRVLTTTAELRAAVAEQLAAAGPGPVSLGLVPTMGALHEGHAALARAARTENDVVVATIFVNPLQFGDPLDLDRYPRTLEADLEILGGYGVDLVFVPSREEMYPGGEPLVRLSAGRLGERFEGEFRPGHFDGMLTVVAKLLHLAWPAADAAYRAYFGQKDAQQLALIRRMVRDLSFTADIRAVPTVRSAEGLALSSRNRFLTAEEADAALVLSRALRLLAERAVRCEPLDLESAVALVESQPLVQLEYFEVVDPDTLEPLAFNCRETPFSGEALALIAARVGSVRLIDNQPLLADPAGT
ncbi:pantoate--beta-alanine ligase [Arthrobacter sp. Soil782]|uniref:pantoate--beta-alanine ligase n=1 Tax=Arthrobacter sp. Soil782 TaxID=1736410 RepID=UPI0006FE5EBF|nr:pantoate--beta-alanine ligase [Arthrobacter sp. Soil782]KRF09111.1 pantoate--beta-alanine ligase [Arthrobacter sp. Soil782]